MGNYSLKYLTQKPHYDKCKYCELCATRCKNTSKNTPLMDACINKNEEEALRLLEDYGKCNVECVNKDHDTALLLACKNKLTKVALKILENPEKCNIGYPDKYDCTALIIACGNNLETVASKILDHPECNIGHSSSMMENTALLIACENNLEKLALNILEYQCNIHQIDNNGHNALYWASVNNLNDVKAKIEKNKYEIYTGRALLVCGIGVVSGLIGYRYVSSK